MRTPLTATRWAVEEVMREDGASSKNEKIKSGLDVSFDRMNNLLDTLSQFAGLEEGQYEKNPVRMDICEEIERAVEEAEPIGMQYGVSVAAEGPCEELWVKIDPVQVDMLLSNLINNGIKYNRRGGTVTVSARPISGGREIEVQVRDSGVGIPAHEQGRIFERLFRGEQATKLNTEGYGLGLYLVKEIVVDHGGRVWVESTPGKGSVFHFALPVGR
jgi:two-component system phosphate regulon sensor histidine kinase PhoR